MREQNEIYLLAASIGSVVLWPITMNTLAKLLVAYQRQ